jgi:hypothetical protein
VAIWKFCQVCCHLLERYFSLFSGHGSPDCWGLKTKFVSFMLSPNLEEKVHMCHGKYFTGGFVEKYPAPQVLCVRKVYRTVEKY